MKVVAIIQARMGSTRLPGKILKKVLDKPLLEYQIERVRRSELIDEIVIATTLNKDEQPIIDFCNKHSLSFYRGSEKNVLSRYYEAAKEHNADVVVRLTSDCPIIDASIIDKVIREYLEYNDSINYTSNTLVRTYPRGMDTEVFSFQTLENTYVNAGSNAEKEHVTPFIYQHPELFGLLSVVNDIDTSNHRWTVDTKEDYLLIKKIIESLYETNPIFSYHDILEVLNNNKEMMNINSDIKQKKL
ncbi:cytidylyltransferase domain-containing protein [Virgibacillus sp. JSM 102003]|uniref:cytidylyltransferase domain-containing protein n=1 Tax=Virgibacillus sp. JSM 102003 TaxID=1562108 RepID=UPI0035C0F3C2